MGDTHNRCFLRLFVLADFAKPLVCVLGGDGRTADTYYGFRNVFFGIEYDTHLHGSAPDRPCTARPDRRWRDGRPCISYPNQCLKPAV